MMSRLKLSISTDYVPEWTVVDAVRELFQNALDQRSEENPMFHSYSDNTLTVGNKTSVLEVKSLLLGMSSKRNNSDTIGKFGEGYKIAALVLTRLGKTLTIYNYGAREVWNFKFMQSRTYNATVLCVDIDKLHFWKTAPDNDLTMVIGGISEAEYELIKASNLFLQGDFNIRSTPFGNILTDDAHKGKVFVNGLYVCTNNYFVYGYDIMPRHITLNRDRRTIPDFDLAYVTGKMWMHTGDEQCILMLAKDNAADVKYLHFNATHSIADRAVTEFKQQYGSSAVPVVSEEQASQARATGLKPVVVTEATKGIMSGSSIPLAPTVKRYSMYDRFYKWFKRYKDSIDKDGIEHFKELLKELKEFDKQNV